MSYTSCNDDLIKLVKELKVEDTVWLLHVINKDAIEFESRIDIEDEHDPQLMDKDIDKLNSIKDLNELKNYLIDGLKDKTETFSETIMDLIDEYKEQLMIRNRDFLKYKSDRRLLSFALYKISSNNRDIYRHTQSISNTYVRFLYIIFTYNRYYRSFKELDRIERKHSEIISAKSLHFKNYDHPEFYKWAKTYIDKNTSDFRDFNQIEFTPLQDVDFGVWVNSIFDIMYDSNQHAYINLKKQLSNAWYQKSYQKNRKGREHHYFLTDEAKKLLKILAAKHKKTEDRMIEHLINKCAIEEGITINEKFLYSV
jgi:hypothetical protein